MMINKGRKANKSATADEKRRLDDPGWVRKQRESERLENKEAWADEMREQFFSILFKISVNSFPD